MKVGFLYQNFASAVSLIKEDRFNLVIVETERELYVVLRERGGYSNFVATWSEARLYDSPGFRCFYQSDERGLADILSALAATFLDIDFRIVYAEVSNIDEAKHRIAEGVPIVFLPDHYLYIFISSPLLERAIARSGVSWKPIKEGGMTEVIDAVIFRGPYLRGGERMSQQAVLDVLLQVILTL